MLDPSKRFLTLMLAVGTAVLLLAILIGEGMGNRVMRSATERRLDSVVAITPAPSQTNGPYGPDWKRSQALTAAPDPGFPDPRVPPVPLPTPPPTPKPVVRPSVSASATPTYNPNIPIWRQKPLPTIAPSAIPSVPKSSVTPAPNRSETPVPGPSIAPPAD